MKHRICTAAACICLLLMMALPAFAVEYGEPDITPQTTMGEIRSNPSILGAGVWTYSKEQNLPGTEDWCNDQTLEKYVSSHVAQDCADGLNLLIRNYNAGVQITYKLYTDEEIAAVPTRLFSASSCSWLSSSSGRAAVFSSSGSVSKMPPSAPQL